MSEVIPVRVQRKRTKGFRLQEASPNGLPVVYVGRPSKWGNPFHDNYHTQDYLIRQYRMWVTSRLYDDAHFLDPLKGKNLACWCNLSEPCHADVLLKILKENQKEEAKNRRNGNMSNERDVLGFRVGWCEVCQADRMLSKDGKFCLTCGTFRKDNKTKPICFGHYTDLDRVFRRCVGCKLLYECNPNEPMEEVK